MRRATFRLQLLAIGILALCSGIAMAQKPAPPVVYHFFPNEGARWHTLFCIGVEECKVGDFNGDHKQDIAAFVRSTVHGSRAGNVLVALSDGTQFTPQDDVPVWQPSFCAGTEICDVGDFNGDGKDDVILFKRDSVSGDARGDVIVALSDGQQFGAGQIWQTLFCTGTELCRVGDFNGDNKVDIIRFERDSTAGEQQGDVIIALSNGVQFGVEHVWHQNFCTGTETCDIGDFNGDNKDDIVLFKRDSDKEPARGDVEVALSDGNTFISQSSAWNSSFCLGTEICDVGDFNGDNKDDVVLFRRDSKTGDAQGDVVVALSDGGRFALQPISPLWHSFFCIRVEVCAVGDVNGDLKDDIIAFVRSSGTGSSMGDVFVAVSTQASLTWIPVASQK